ncbi:MAG TPA: DUF2339 domain-containing protein [Chitinophagaceae bacterium]|nr:DUF2339 domain-containing protein [Chitinophagaceae bacterium]
MEILLLLVIFVIVLVLLSKQSATEAYIKRLQDDIYNLHREMERLFKDAAVKKQEPPKPPEPAPTPEVIVKPAPVKEVLPEITPVKEKVFEPVKVQPAEEKPSYSFDKITPAKTTEKLAPFVYEPRESWFDRWLRDNPDLEKFIGENLINKIGIAVLVLGIGFFVKYAIDQDWIKDIGRICIGLFCGMLLIGLAHRLRKNYHSFSSVLVGGGLTVFYFTIALAFHEYHRLGQTSAFAIMVVITVFAVVLSILYNRLELAIIATVGGFATPFLVSNGQNNYMALFTYLAVLNAGLIALAYYKRWRALNFISFVFTQAIYLAWIVTNSNATDFNYRNTFLFGCVFYAMFLAMNVIHHASRGSKLKAFDFIILLAVNLCFYGAGMYLMYESDMTVYKGLFTVVMGIINLALAWSFFKKSKADRNFIYLLIAITVTYISLAAPVQLNGHYITLFWAAETVVLLWLYQRSFIKLLKIASLIVTVFMAVSLVMDWGEVYMQNVASAWLPVIINKGFITGIVCGTAMLLVYSLLKKEADTYYFSGIRNRDIRVLYIIAAVVLFFISGALEVQWQFDRFDTINANASLMPLYLRLYAIAFVLLLFSLFDKFKAPLPMSLDIVITGVVTFIYFLTADFIRQSENMMLTSGKYKLHFLAAFVSFTLLLLLIYRIIVKVQKLKLNDAASMGVFTWLTTLAIIGIFSIEAHNIFVWMYYSGNGSINYAENLYGKAGLSIVWGLSSFIIIWLGLSKKYKPLRIIALVVFGITLVKLFAYDISNIPVGGKIAAFILLGIVLLVVSFMYQRLKKLIIDDKVKD